MRKHGGRMLQILMQRRSVAALCIISVVFLHSTKAACVTSCVGKLPLISYSSCDSCKKYVTCDIFGQLTTRDCLLGMVYDDTLSLCLPFLGSCADYVSPSTPATTSASATRKTIPTTTSTTSKQPAVPTNPLLTISTAAPPLKPILSGKTLLKSIYIKVMLQTSPCIVNASQYKSTFGRSKIECAGRCDHDPQCWYFKLTNQTCLLYSLSLPPCNVYIYKYIG